VDQAQGGAGRQDGSDRGRPHLDYLESLMDAVGVVVWEFDTSTGSFTFVSDAAAKLLGFPLDQWLRPGFWIDHLHPDDVAWASAVLGPGARDRRDQQVEYRMLRADGKTVWARDHISVDDDQRLRGLLFDITPQKLAEERLSTSDHRFQEIVDGVGLLAVEMDSAGTIIYANAAIERLFGGGPIVGSSLASLVAPEHRDAVEAAFEDRIATGGTGQPFGIPLMAASDGAREIRWRSANTYGPRGEFAGVMSIGEDVTERAAFERERARKAEEFDAIFNLTRDLFFRIGPDDVVVTYSAPNNDSLYAPPSAFLGRDITAVLPPPVAEVLDRGKTQAHATGEMAVGEYELPLGEEMREWEARFLPLADGDTAVVIRDITGRKAAERESHSRLEGER
jgi:PAS domain S-box-containing protein